jgi:hypothetical protein
MNNVGERANTAYPLWFRCMYPESLSMVYHLDVVGGPSTPHDPESDAGGSLNSWQCHPSW